MSRVRTVAVAFVVTSFMLGAAPRAESAPPERPFRSSVPAYTAFASIASVAEDAVDVDVAALRRARDLEIDLLDGTRIVVQRTRLRQRSEGDFSWQGRIAGAPGSRGDVLLSARDGAVSGIFFTPGGVYELIPGASGSHRFVLLDQALFPECDGGLLPDETDGGTASAGQASAADAADRFDVLVVYTPQARSGAGGTSQVEATIQNAIDATNAAYANSQIVPRLQLVHTEEVGYSDSGSFSSDLSWLRSDAGVAALRDAHGADLVAMIVNGGNACGIGYVQRTPGASFAPYAFQVTARGCAVGNLSFAHEFGHNQGSEHNPENSSAYPSGGSYPWSYAHWHDGAYRTVMSYSNPCTGGCTRQPFFSNPNVSHTGLPTGVAGDRENFRTINDTATYVANFRQAASGCGDGVLDAGEECDGGNLAGATCSTFGHSEGALACNADCTFDTSGCSTCGNGAREADEICDGGDLGGGTCGDYGCSAGSLACNATCDDYDTTSCSQCPVCDNDGTCEAGEDCNGCPSDCPSGAGASCGNGVCEVANGEDCATCAADCNGKQNGKPSNRYCCGDGGENPVGCSDSRCDQGEWSCSLQPSAASCCGDGSCTGSESGTTCELDCGPAPFCGDGSCNSGEDTCSCASDCGAPPATETGACTLGVDDDCDGFTDCADDDCSLDPACSCLERGATCSSAGECCSGSCKGKRGSKTCK